MRNELVSGSAVKPGPTSAVSVAMIGGGAAYTSTCVQNLPAGSRRLGLESACNGGIPASSKKSLVTVVPTCGRAAAIPGSEALRVGVTGSQKKLSSVNDAGAPPPASPVAALPPPPPLAGSWSVHNPLAQTKPAPQAVLLWHGRPRNEMSPGQHMQPVMLIDSVKSIERITKKG
jgi:hypothetical protein